MKRILCLLLLFLLMTSVSVSFASCSQGNRVPDGTYSCIAGDTGEQYIFEGRRVTVRLYIMAEVVIDFSGTYRLSGDEITFDFPQDNDDIYSGTRSYAISEDGSRVTIDKDVFIKE